MLQVGLYDPSAPKNGVEWDPMIRFVVGDNNQWIHGYATYSARGKADEIFATPRNDPHRLGFKQPATPHDLKDIEAQLVKFFMVNQVWTEGEGETSATITCQIIDLETRPVLYAPS